MTQEEATQEPLPFWEDMDQTPAPPPTEWLLQPHDFADEEPPPQLVRTVNLLDVPEHDLRGPEDVSGIADFILARAREGIDDIFAHEDYSRCDGEGEAWARAIAEHQTGIPYTMPAYFYDGGQAKVARTVVSASRYPLVGQCQQSVTTALCLGGWDGGPYGDVGAGIDAQPSAAKLGAGWTDVPAVLADWPDELWEQVTVGSCLFWSAACPMTRDGTTCGASGHVPGCGRGSGHVALVIRKHPTDRKWQLWDTTTSFNDPVTHPSAVKGARMLWESHWWPWIAKTLSGGAWQFRGIAKIDGLGEVRGDLKPRGRCRLLLRRRSDNKLLYRSAWLSMEREGLPISWLLRSVRGAPFFDSIEATWCINSACDVPSKNVPDNRPLLDVFCDAKGNAKMAWSATQGLHNRPRVADWSPAAALGASPTTEVETSADAAGDEATEPAASAEAPASDPGAELQSELLAGEPGLQKVVARRASALARGARGPSVKALQEALLSLGFEVPGGADGAFGAGLATAVKAFQAQKGLTADGVVGAGTLLAVDAELGGSDS